MTTSNVDYFLTVSDICILGLITMTKIIMEFVCSPCVCICSL